MDVRMPGTNGLIAVETYERSRTLTGSWLSAEVHGIGRPYRRFSTVSDTCRSSNVTAAFASRANVASSSWRCSVT